MSKHKVLHLFMRIQFIFCQALSSHWEPRLRTPPPRKQLLSLIALGIPRFPRVGSGCFGWSRKIKMSPLQGIWVWGESRNQWRIKPHQTCERDTGLWPDLLRRRGRTRWKWGSEESQSSGGHRHAPKWLVTLCVITHPRFKVLSSTSMKEQIKYS